MQSTITVSRSKEDKWILVIDDDPGILEAISDVLELEGYQAETSTRDGEYLEQSIGRKIPDLIILDVLLSGHDGRAICRRLKSRPETSYIPVVLISAHPGARVTSLEAGADAFLAKPFNVDDLLATVERFVLPA